MPTIAAGKCLELSNGRPFGSSSMNCSMAVVLMLAP